MRLHLGSWLAAATPFFYTFSQFAAHSAAATVPRAPLPPNAPAAGQYHPATELTSGHDVSYTPSASSSAVVAALPDSSADGQQLQPQQQPRSPVEHVQQSSGIGGGVYAALATAYGMLRAFVRPGARVKWPYGELSDADERKLWMDASGGGADGLGGSGVGGRARRRRLKLVYAKAAHLRQKYGMPEAISLCVARKYWPATQLDLPRGHAEIVKWQSECMRELAWRNMGVEQRQALVLQAATDLEQQRDLSPAMALCVAERLLPVNMRDLPSPDDTARRRRIIQWCREAVARGYDPTAAASRSGARSTTEAAPADPIANGRSTDKSVTAPGEADANDHSNSGSGFAGRPSGYAGMDRDPATGTPIFPPSGATGSGSGSSSTDDNTSSRLSSVQGGGHTTVVQADRRPAWGKLLTEALRGRSRPADFKRSGRSRNITPWSSGRGFPGQMPGNLRVLRAWRR